MTFEEEISEIIVVNGVGYCRQSTHISKQRVREAINKCSKQLLQFNEQKLILPEELIKELGL